MAIEKMNLVMVSTKPDRVMNMLECIHDYPSFHPELSADVLTDKDEGGLPLDKEKEYERFKGRLEKAFSDLNLEVIPEYTKSYSNEVIEDTLQKLEKMVIISRESVDYFSELSNDDVIAIEALQEYPMDHLEEGFVHMMFGKMTVSNFEKISYYHDQLFLYKELHRNKRNVWVVVLCLMKDVSHFEEIFTSLKLEPITIQDSMIHTVDIEMRKELAQIIGYVNYMAEIENYYRYVSVYNDRAVLAGFIKAEDVEEFRKIFDKEVVTHFFPPDIHESLVAPTSLKNNRFAAPFQMLIEMYGLPRYGEYDPTPFFAISYSILFGIMFGDLGQGLVISILGFILSKWKNMKLGDIMFRLGFFSMIFGTIYGSFFGDEEILLPLLKPIGLPIHVTSNDFTMTLLISAVALGVFLILSGLVINIMSSIKHKRTERAFFTQNGLAGFIFYGFIVVGVGLQFMGINIINPLTIGLCIATPLLVIFLKDPIMNLIEKKPIKPHGGWGNYFVESFFELFEVLLGFVSNTLSFMRVGGFVLSHAGMMSVVMTLREMSGSASILVLILGNILVIGLEGLIVGIQTLRLQYYEIFSRFYDAGGKPFKSVN